MAKAPSFPGRWAIVELEASPVVISKDAEPGLPTLVQVSLRESCAAKSIPDPFIVCMSSYSSAKQLKPGP